MHELKKKWEEESLSYLDWNVILSYVLHSSLSSFVIAIGTIFIVESKVKSFLLPGRHTTKFESNNNSHRMIEISFISMRKQYYAGNNNNNGFKRFSKEKGTLNTETKTKAKSEILSRYNSHLIRGEHKLKTNWGNKKKLKRIISNTNNNLHSHNNSLNWAKYWKITIMYFFEIKNCWEIEWEWGKWKSFQSICIIKSNETKNVNFIWNGYDILRCLFESLWKSTLVFRFSFISFSFGSICFLFLFVKDMTYNF